MQITDVLVRVVRKKLVLLFFSFHVKILVFKAVSLRTNALLIPPPYTLKRNKLVVSFPVYSTPLSDTVTIFAFVNPAKLANEANISDTSIVATPDKA